MTALFLALLLGQATDPVAWVVVPKVSTALPKLQATPWKNEVSAEAVKSAANDSLVVTYYTSGKHQMLLTANDQAPYTSDPATAQAASVATNPDVEVVFSTGRALKAIGAESNGVSFMRVVQRLGIDKVQNVVGGASIAGTDGIHFDALAGYPPPRSGFVEAFGPAVAGSVPAWVPKEAAEVACVSVIPSAVFNQGNLAFAAADPMDQALFFTHLRGLESQLRKRFADDGLGTTPRLWTTYRRGSDIIGVLEVADITVVKSFVDSYAAAVTALLPGTRVERGKVGTHETLSVTLPDQRAFAVGFAKTSIVIADNAKALQTHFASKGRGKPQTVVASAIAYGTSNALLITKGAATWSMSLTDAGLRFSGDVKAKK